MTEVWLKRYAAVVAGLTVVHGILAALNPVSGDEAYYWDCSRHPDWSYFDQPPLVIWAMIPFRLVFGESALAVRAPAVAASLLLAVFLVPLMRRLGGGPREATWAYLLLHVMPLVFVGSFYASTDVAMVTAYVGATWAAVSLAQGVKRGWYGFGIACGLGFLAKFPVVLAAFALLPALRQREVRRQLLTPTPYLAASLSLALTAPVWIWGALHDWDNIAFQLVGRHQRASSGGIEHFLTFIAGNFLLATPFLLVAMFLAVWRSRRQVDPGWSVFRMAMLTPFLFFGLIALRKHVGMHWAWPGLVLGVVALALVAVPGRKTWIALGAATGLPLSLAVLFLATNPETALAAIRNVRPDSTLPKGFARMIGNDEITAKIRDRLRPGEIVSSESYSTVHLLGFWSDGQIPTALVRLGGGKHGLASLYWQPPDHFLGKDVLFVTARPGVEEGLVPLFESCREEDPIRVLRAGETIRQVHVTRCENLLEPAPAFSRL